MSMTQYNQELFDFLQQSPTPFHAIESLQKTFLQHGFSHLKENESWKLDKGHSYFITRQQSALIAFTIGDSEEDVDGFRIITTHSDSPGLQIKPAPESTSKGYNQLGVEVYGGPLLATWFDRDLTLAGRVCCTLTDGSLKVLLINFERPILTIPSLAIHFNREANTAHSINKQKDLPPVFALANNDGAKGLEELILQRIEEQYSGCKVQSLHSFDLFCLDTQRPALIGTDNEFIAAARLDNLLSTHSGLKAMIQADKGRNSLFYVANHEENGSVSATGAQGSFISSIFERIIPDGEKRQRSYSKSFIISVDNAHATHPNAADTMDPHHHIELNKGVAIKVNANQRYTTNSLSSAIYKKICADAGVTTQEFVMRSDLPCGSTIGPVTSARLGVLALDVGAPTLGMHSIRELTGSKDPELLFRSLAQFLSSDIHKQLILT
jgi:aspartyl aminopeptidase